MLAPLSSTATDQMSANKDRSDWVCPNRTSGRKAHQTGLERLQVLAERKNCIVRVNIYTETTVFSPMMNRDPRGRLLVESAISALRPMSADLPHAIVAGAEVSQHGSVV